jgi:hypothetical protein
VNTWYALKIVVNAAGTNVAFYVNGSLISTHVTNIPATTSGFGFGVGIFKSIGTTSAVLHCDYVKLGHAFTTAR